MLQIVAVLLMVCMGRFARYSTRRANYELFYYLHHAFLAAFSVALLHAASSWYYLVGGLALWFLDRGLRALKRARRWCVLDVSPWPDGVTRLEIAPLDDFCGRSSPFAFAPGQYLYLNLPCLGPHEWHPFTISSAPSDGVVTCHIKAAPVAPGQKKNSTWTGRLHDLAVATAAKRSSGVVSLQVRKRVFVCACFWFRVIFLLACCDSSH
jgi:predicted ferric reductase